MANKPAPAGLEKAAYKQIKHMDKATLERYIRNIYAAGYEAGYKAAKEEMSEEKT